MIYLCGFFQLSLLAANMSTLFVYGDSYAANAWGGGIWWPREVANRLGHDHIIDHAVAGSSAEFSMQQFVNDMSVQRIAEGDAIIFVISGGGRAFFDEQLTTKGAATAAMFASLSDFDFGLPQYKWFNEHRKHLEWYYAHSNYTVSMIHHECYVHALKSFAETHPSNKVLVLSIDNETPMFALGNMPDNFFAPQITLNKISLNELHDNVSMHDWCIPFGRDIRHNHFSLPNLTILSELISNTFMTGNIDGWVEEAFMQRILPKITTPAQYMQCVDDGSLFFCQYTVDSLLV